MLIDSPFFDYYDKMMESGVDRDCVYKRITTNLGKDKDIDVQKIPYSTGKLKNQFDDIEFTPIVVGFAGKIYPIIRFIGESKSSKPVIVHLFSLEEYEEFIEENQIRPSKNRFSYFYRNSLDSSSGVKGFFSTNFLNLEILFVKHSVPVFQIELEKHAPVLILNPKLKDVDFVKIKDNYTAYQEIFMFKAGVLGNTEKEIITISDKDKAKQHGHDGKYSFKTPKVKK